jgi:hypothetical protein
MPDTSPGAAAGAASDTRTVEEADVYKRVGSTLFVLNAWRGLLAVDLADVASPKFLSRVPVSATPVDLYVRGGVAFLAVSDWFVYTFAPDGGARPYRGSRLIAVDVADPAVPHLLAELPVEGQIEQTRLVGDVLYVVSRRWWWWEWIGPVAVGGGVGIASPTAGSDTVFVASFDVRDPSRPLPVDRIELPATGWSTHANVTAERITLSFAGWEQGAAGAWGPVTNFQAIDISDPGGKLRAGTSFGCPGLVNDRWGMDFDAASGLFRAVLATGWAGGAALQIWSSPTPDAAEPLSRLAVEVAESLTAARFDGSRVYVVTAQRTDPLWAIDASDPAHPWIAGQLAMPGQLDFVEPRGDRLVALGHTNEAGLPFQLAVSLLDVADLAAPRLLSRAIFGAGWAWLAVRPDDLRKAFLVFDPPPADVGLVLVPLQGWDPATWKFVGGTQLLDLGRDALKLEGFLAHPGAVTRAFPAEPSGNHLVALSDEALQTIDATDRAAPVELARLDLARSVNALAIVRGAAVELAGDWARAVELVVTDALDPDAPAPLARVPVAAPSAALYQDGDIAWLMAQDWNTVKAWLQAVDLTDPVHPVLRGRLDLDPADAVGSIRGYWGYGGEAVLVGHALAIHRAYWWWPCPADYACGPAPRDEVRVFDLADPDRPRLASAVALPEATWSWGLAAFGPYLWLTHYEWDGRAALGRYFVDRIDLRDPQLPVLLPKVNVPGVFFAASPDGGRIYTLESGWEAGSTTWMHGLLLVGGKARLYGSAPLKGYPAGAAAGTDFAWAVATDWSGDVVRTRLAAVALRSMALASEQPVDGSWAWLAKAAGGKVFLQAGWGDQGILIYDLGDPGHPTFERFVRTQGWVSDVVVAGGWAYLPSGPYGVPMVKLAP